MSFLQDAASLATIVGAGAGIVGVAVGILYQRRTYQTRITRQLKQKALDLEKDLIVRREFFVRVPKDQIIPTVEKQLGPEWTPEGDNTESAAGFRPSEISALKKSYPKLWTKISSLHESGNESKFDLTVDRSIMTYYRNLRNTTPGELRVRVEGEDSFGGTRCLAECRPVLYKRIIVPEFGGLDGDLMLQAQAAKIECRTFLEDLIVKIGGRKDSRSMINLA